MPTTNSKLSPAALAAALRARGHDPKIVETSLAMVAMVQTLIQMDLARLAKAIHDDIDAPGGIVKTIIDIAVIQIAHEILDAQEPKEED